MATVKKYEATPEDLKTMEYVTSLPDQTQEVPWYKSYPSAIGRGVVKGLQSVGQSFGDPRGLMLDETGQESLPEEALNTKSLLNEEQTLQLNNAAEKNFPIGNDTIPKLLERGTKAGTESVAFIPFAGVGQTLGRAAAGGIGAELAKEAGFGDRVQTGVEIGTQIAPDLGRTIVNRLPGAANRLERRLLQEGRRLGLTEEELALTLNQRGVVTDSLQMVSTKGGRVPDRFQGTRDALSRVWNNLRGTPEAQVVLTPQARQDLINNISTQMARLPAAQVDLIRQDWHDLLRSPNQGTDLIDFWQKLNYHIARGEGGLGTLKGALQEGINSISPSLGHDFQITNQLYGNFHRLAERMQPNVASTLFSHGESTAILGAIVTGNYPVLLSALGVKGARQLATELVTNPRFMNLSSKMINALERGLPNIAKHTYDQLIIEVGKNNAEAASQMSDVNFDSLLKEIRKKESEEKKK
jgi:hypothetical protein